ncbi:winged helix-turn-helix transcriptional regulator [Anaerofilum sp. BX8]|uniref:Winged helix-turn-helix transcriptional regulator n=1 Tax=Anaerofilum hominis TaxID=2763016 RepID=A0A923I604_9FIRM|nr:metalloregulator ArsR/SmtB family transcription factor [Anaerofilum hominis]MBC5580953.1 winged helix-turn-helix transcriptional regulator [Anaerofilum hominis]
MSKATLAALSECIPIFTMLQDENRQQILMLLFDHHSMTVSELTDHLALSRPAVSHHLKLLRDCGLIQAVKNGKERIYSLSMDKAVVLLKNLLQSLERDMNLTPG